MADQYNSAHTGAEIDQAVSDVQNNKDAWGSKPQPSGTTPKAPGTASAGSESAYARGDHVHPEPESTEATVIDAELVDPGYPMKKIILPVASWNSSTMQQSVSCEGILADGTKQLVFCSGVDESYDSAWNTCYVQCVGRAADSLTFQCSEVPTVAVEVYVAILPVSFTT